MSISAPSNSFLADIKKSHLANVYEAKNVYWAHGITALRTKYTNGPIERKSAARSLVAALSSALRQRPSRGWPAPCADGG